LSAARGAGAGVARVGGPGHDAYDAAWGVGAAGFGFVVAPVGYPAAFALTPCIPLSALTLASRERRRVAGAAATVASAYLDA
jgi:hypothetical protein